MGNLIPAQPIRGIRDIREIREIRVIRVIRGWVWEMESHPAPPVGTRPIVGIFGLSGP